MKSIPSISNTFRTVFFGVIFLLVLGVFAPQHVEARVELQRAMPVTDGDPDGVWDYNSGGSGGGYEFLPPDEEQNGLDFIGEKWSLSKFQIYPILPFGLMPYYNGHPLPWTTLFFGNTMHGGLN